MTDLGYGPPRNGDSLRVLVVEDQLELLELYAAWLETDYDVLQATSEKAAIEIVDETVDIAFLDRRMQEGSGDAVLHEIRDEGYDCRVAMVTAVDPKIDILDLGFDDYLVKPVRRDDLLAAAETMARRSTYNGQTQEFFMLASKKAALESVHGSEIAEYPEYHALRDQLSALRRELDSTLEELSTRDFEAAFHAIPEP